LGTVVTVEDEGLLIEVEGTITRGPTNDLSFGYSVFLDDGTGETQIFIPASTGVNLFDIPFVTPGNRIRVSGFGGQFQAQYEVLPRFRGDIHPAN
jgi:DNA/RNA endonuclease YhcR with UshA esterase domain